MSAGITLADLDSWMYQAKDAEIDEIVTAKNFHKGVASISAAISAMFPDVAKMCSARDVHYQANVIPNS